PNLRSSHKDPTPRGGGVAIVMGFGAGLAAGGMLGLEGPSLHLILGSMMIAAAGLLEDTTHAIPLVVRLATQCGAAFFVLSRAGGIGRIPLPYPFDISLG